MTCKYCIHNDLCTNIAYNQGISLINGGVSCRFFKDKSKIIELPCKVGDTVYINAWFGNAVPYKVTKLRVPFVATCLENSPDNTADFYLDQIGKSVFLTREEAEKALNKININ